MLTAEGGPLETYKSLPMGFVNGRHTDCNYDLIRPQGPYCLNGHPECLTFTMPFNPEGQK